MHKDFWCIPLVKFLAYKQCYLVLKEFSLDHSWPIHKDKEFLLSILGLHKTIQSLENTPGSILGLYTMTFSLQRILHTMTCILLIILVALFFVYMQSFLLFGEFALFYSWPVQKAIQCLENSHCSNLDLHTKHFYLFSYLGPRQKYFYFSLQRFPHALILAHPKSHLVTGIFPLFYLWPTRKDFGEFPMFYTWLVQRAFWRITLIHFLIYIQRHLISKFLFFFILGLHKTMNSIQNGIYSLEKSFYSRSTHKDIHSLRNSFCYILSMHTVIFWIIHTKTFILWRNPIVLHLACTNSHLVSGELPIFYSQPLQKVI